jgi:hypothetical protein
MDTGLIAYIVGLTAFFVGFIGLVQKDDSKLFDWSIFSWLLFILHFAIKSDVNSMLVSFFILSSFILSRDNYRNLYILSSFIIIISSYFYYKIDHVHELIQALSVFITTIGIFSFRKIDLRLILIVSSMTVLLIAMYYESNSLVIHQFISLLCLIISIFLIKKENRQKELQLKK